MKKKLMGILLCFCLTAGIMSGCGANSESTSRDAEQTENRSRSTEAVSEAEAQSEEAEKIVYYLAKETDYVECRSVNTDFCIEYEYEYDVNGNLTRESHFEHNGFNSGTGEFNHAETRTEYGYDESGKVTFEERRSNRGEFVTDVRTEYEYDEAGRLISTSDGKEYKYDESGRLIFSSDEGNYKYDESGRLISIDSSDFRTEYGYDEAGNLVKETAYNGEGIVQENEYDTNGNEIKCTYYQIYQGPVTYVREYDANGNVVKEDEYRRGEDELTTSNEYEYDEKGRVVRRSYITYKTTEGEIHTEPYTGEDTYTYEEEYDEAGNLIKVSNYMFDNLLSYIEYEYIAK